MYNAETVRQMFEEKAVLFVDQDGVMLRDVIHLFGKDAISAAIDSGESLKSFHWFTDARGTKELFVTYHGFRLIATYVNLQEFQHEKESQHSEAQPKAKPKNRRKNNSSNVIDIRPMLKEKGVTKSKATAKLEAQA